MAQVTTGRIYECAGHSQEGHELAANHPVVVVGRQSLIDNQKIAIVVPMTSTRPHYPVHWAVEIEDTNSHAYIRHVKSVHITNIGDSLGTAAPEEMDDIKDGLARELQYDNHDRAMAWGREVRPGGLWSASKPNARGLRYEGVLLILTSNRDTGMATALAVDARPRRDARLSMPVAVDNSGQPAFAITYQVRSVSTEERLTGYIGDIPDDHLTFAKSALIRCVEP